MGLVGYCCLRGRVVGKLSALVSRGVLVVIGGVSVGFGPWSGVGFVLGDLGVPLVQLNTSTTHAPTNTLFLMKHYTLHTTFIRDKLLQTQSKILTSCGDLYPAAIGNELSADTLSSHQMTHGLLCTRPV